MNWIWNYLYKSTHMHNRVMVNANGLCNGSHKVISLRLTYLTIKKQHVFSFQLCVDSMSFLSHHILCVCKLLISQDKLYLTAIFVYRLYSLFAFNWYYSSTLRLTLRFCTWCRQISLKFIHISYYERLIPKSYFPGVCKPWILNGGSRSGRTWESLPIEVVIGCRVELPKNVFSVFWHALFPYLSSL